MKSEMEILKDAELDMVTGGSKKLSSPGWLDDIKSEMSPAELVSLKEGNFIQRLKGIFQRMQLD